MTRTSNFRHIVLFRIREGVDDADVQTALGVLRALRGTPGVVSWNVELSLDERKGRMIVEDATFADEAAFAAFRERPDHVSAGRLMAEVSDWWIGDYITQPERPQSRAE